MPGKSSRKTIVILTFTLVVGILLYVYGPPTIQAGNYSATITIDAPSINTTSTYNIFLIDSGSDSQGIYQLNGTSTTVEVTVPLSTVITTDNPITFVINATGDTINADSIHLVLTNIEGFKALTPITPM